MSYLLAIGGARGTGKSIIAYALDWALNGWGSRVREAAWAREALRTHPPEEAPQELFKSCLGAETFSDTIRYLQTQAEHIKQFHRTYACTETEQDLVIIAGTHLIPGIFERGKTIKQHVILEASPETLERRILADEKPRSKTCKALQRNIELQDWLISEAQKYHVPIINSESMLTASFRIIRSLPEEMRTYSTHSGLEHLPNHPALEYLWIEHTLRNSQFAKHVDE